MNADSGRSSPSPAQRRRTSRSFLPASSQRPGAGEDFRDVERLGQEAFDLTSAADDEFVFFSQFIDTENRDDVLQRLVEAGGSTGLSSTGVVLFAEDRGVENCRGRGERVDRGEDALLGNTTGQNDEGVEVAERSRGRGRSGRPQGHKSPGPR